MHTEPKETTKPTQTDQKETKETNGTTAAPTKTNDMFKDFFESIEQEQQTMFNPQTGSPTANYFQQQASYNPFVARQLSYPPVGSTPYLQSQPTGYLQPQITGFAFGGIQSLPPQPNFDTAFGMQSANPFPVAQNAFGPSLGASAFGNPGSLQPQPTGFNPFRQSVMQPQATGAFPNGTGAFGPPAFPQSQPSFDSNSAFQSNIASATPNLNASQPAPFNPSNSFLGSVAGMSTSPAPQSTTPTPGGFIPPPMSASPKPLVPQATGSRNPFGPPPGTIPSVPKLPQNQPSLNALAASAFAHRSFSTPPTAPTSQSSLAPSSNSAFGSTMTNVSSSFFGQINGTTSPAGTISSTSPFAPSVAASSSPAIPTSQTFGAPSPLVPQRTGFGGSTVKPFQPSSSFGASLAEKLPPIAEPTGAETTNFGNSTGAFTPNPFRSATMPPSLNNQGTGATSLSSNPTGSTSLGSSAFSNFSTPFGAPSTSFTGTSANSAFFPSDSTNPFPSNGFIQYGQTGPSRQQSLI